MAIFSVHRDLEQALASVENFLSKINDFLNRKGLTISTSKSQYMIFTKKRISPSPRRGITLNQQAIPLVSHARFLESYLTLSLPTNSS